MIRTLRSVVAIGVLEQKCQLSFFWLAEAFFCNPNTINLKVFPNYGGIYSFVRKFNKFLERDKEIWNIEIWGGISLSVILKDLVSNWRYGCSPFCWFWPRGWTRGGNRIRGIGFEKRGWSTCCTPVLGVEENFMRSICACLLLFWVTKK